MNHSYHLDFLDLREALEDVIKNFDGNACVLNVEVPLELFKVWSAWRLLESVHDSEL